MTQEKLTMKKYRVPVSILVEATSSQDARDTVSAFLQRDDGELDDGTAILAWWYPGQKLYTTEEREEE